MSPEVTAAAIVEMISGASPCVGDRRQRERHWSIFAGRENTIKA
jgi:hypothetical protein